MKKVLIITYYWPPSGGPGVQRVLNFVKHLPNWDWEPHVLTVIHGEYPALDHSLIKEIRPTCSVYKTYAFEPNVIYKKFTGKSLNDPLPVATVSEKQKNWKEKFSKWIRLNLFIPDAKIGWKPFAVHSGKKLISKIKPDLILSSSPPHTVHLIAKKLARWSQLPWIADFRDPWTMIYHYDNVRRIQFIQNFEKKIEQDVLQQATHLVTVSDNVREILDIHSLHKTKFTIIPNGFDTEKISSLAQIPKSEKFTIAYAGKLNHQQNAENLWNAVDHLLAEDRAFPKDLEIKFMGNISQQMIGEFKNYKFGEKIKYMGYQDHLAMLKILKSSAVLLLLIANTRHNKGILSGKIFDYLSTRNYILGIGPTDGDAAQILTDTNCGHMYNYDENLKRVISNLYLNWKKGTIYRPKESEIEKYSRKNLTRKLVELMDKLV